MSTPDTNGGSGGAKHRGPPSNPHRSLECRSCGHEPPGPPAAGDSPPEDYEISFYPGFASHIHVNDHVVYAEEGAFVLPSGTDDPWPMSAVTIRNRKKDFTVTLHVQDPQHMIHRIHVELLEPDQKKVLKEKRKKERERAQAGTGGVHAAQSDPKADTIVVTNTPTLCPPEC